MKISDLEAMDYKPTAKNVVAELDRLEISKARGAELLRISVRTMQRHTAGARDERWADGKGEKREPAFLPMPFATFTLLRSLRK